MSDPSEPAAELVEHFFRHEAGALTATLVRRFGVHRLEQVEDAVQLALEHALRSWGPRGAPDRPAAWLYRAAVNRMLDDVRHEKVIHDYRSARGSEMHTSDLSTGDDLLILLFSCADERNSPRARLVMCLKFVSGFSIKEIATCLFMSTENVQKTLERGRQKLKERWANSESAIGACHHARLETVQLVLYLQFNEGYTVRDEHQGPRMDLCEEAIRLVRILCEHSIGNRTSTWALLGLLHLHAARIPARLSAHGKFIPLKDQDRSVWDVQHLEAGLSCVAHVARDNAYTRFHGEFAVQVEHAIAPDFSSTRWGEIASLYDALDHLSPSPLYVLNRAVALSEAGEPEEGLALLVEHDWPGWFRSNHLLLGALGDLSERVGKRKDAARYFERASEAAPSSAEREHFSHRIGLCR